MTIRINTIGRPPPIVFDGWSDFDAASFALAAYGEVLAVHGSNGVAVPATAALTSLGYSGEHFDAKAQQQYLRARWYDPANGRFNRLDPFSGNMQDPQSLHKYAYVHGDPIHGADPTGKFISVGLVGLLGGSAISLGLRTKYDLGAVGTGAAFVAGAGLAYLGFVQLGNVSRMWLGGYTEKVNLYVTPLAGQHANDQSFRRYRQYMLDNEAIIEERFNNVSPQQMTFNLIDGSLPAGTAPGWDRSTKTLNIEVDWRDAVQFIAQGSNNQVGVYPRGFERQLQHASDLGIVGNPSEQEKSTYIANIVLHETTHVVLDLARNILQWDAYRDHRSTGLMRTRLPFTEASREVLDFDDYTLAQMRAAMGHRWAWY